MCISLVINGPEYFLIFALLMIFCLFGNPELILFSPFSPDNLELWTDHPFLGMAKITFSLSVLLGFLYTIWLFLPYIPGVHRLPFFGWIGCIISFSEGAPLFWERSLASPNPIFPGTGPLFLSLAVA